MPRCHARISRVGVNRYNFLLESLKDLDERWGGWACFHMETLLCACGLRRSLRARGSRLLAAQQIKEGGNPLPCL